VKHRWWAATPDLAAPLYAVSASPLVTDRGAANVPPLRLVPATRTRPRLERGRGRPEDQVVSGLPLRGAANEARVVSKMIHFGAKRRRLFVLDSGGLHLLDPGGLHLYNFKSF
jgi:hypothetical protein